MEDPLIPPEWAAALNASPDDFQLRLAFSDWLREQGDELAADAIKWSAEKRRVPRGVSAFAVYWRSWGDLTEGERELPRELFNSFPSDDVTPKPHDTACAIWRVIYGWRRLTPEQREACHEWTPPS